MQTTRSDYSMAQKCRDFVAAKEKNGVYASE